MRSLIVSALIVACALAVPRDSVEVQWQQFQLTHNITYSTPKEHELRRSVFLKNLQKIKEHNEKYEKGLVSWEMGVNKFSDWTRQEFSAYVNKYKMPARPANPKRVVFEYPEGVELAPSVDWRAEGAVSEVKDQGNCGSCWSFSATGAIEAVHQMYTGELVSLSEENLIDCSSDYGNNGCDGGVMDYAFQYVIDNGIQEEADYPYNLGEGECEFDPYQSVLQLSDYGDVHRGNEKQLAAAVSRQPVSIAIDATDDLQHYKSGVFTDPGCSETELNHGVLAVGYGTENGKDYWIVKNSWGESWGEGGYVRMVRNKANHCGVATQASYPIL